MASPNDHESHFVSKPRRNQAFVCSGWKKKDALPVRLPLFWIWIPDKHSLGEIQKPFLLLSLNEGSTCRVVSGRGSDLRKGLTQNGSLVWEYLDRKTQASEPNQTTFRPNGSRTKFIDSIQLRECPNDLFPLACSCRQLSNAERKRHQGLYQMWLLGLTTLLEFWVLH